MRRQMNDEDGAEARCAAWIDPATGRVNVTLARTTTAGTVEVADDHDCSTRGLRYSTAIDEDAETWLIEPSPVTASLERVEAIALLDALDRLELVERGPRLSQHVPGTPRAGGAPWTG